MNRFAKLCLIGVAVLGMIPSGSALATIWFDGSPGTGAPPPTLGGYTMSPFNDDVRAEGTLETTVPAPTGGNVLLAPGGIHESVGSGWATWSHGYTGDVYTYVGQTTVTLSMPPNTNAFYLYVEPNTFGEFDVMATATDGTNSGLIPVDGFAGARYFGFYASDAVSLATITIAVDGQANGFAIGEFGIAVGQDFQLPVKLSHFNASASKGNVTLDWATASEVSNAGFEIQRAIGSGEFTPIASYLTNQELEGLGTSAIGRRYGYVDQVKNDVAKLVSYRLVDVSLTGERTVHGEVRVRIEAGPGDDIIPDLFTFKLNSIAPNPAGNTLSVEFSLAEESDVAVEIYSATCELVATPITGTFGAGPHSTSASINDLQEGTYTVLLSNGRSMQSGKLVIVR
jgi:hypothetical protein